MAKVTVEFDSVEKTCVVKMDGKEMANAETINFYYVDTSRFDYESDKDPYWSCNIGMCKRDEDNQMNTYTSISARYSKEGQEALQSGAGTLVDEDNKDTGFVVGKKKEITDKLGEYLKQFRSK